MAERGREGEERGVARDEDRTVVDPRTAGADAPSGARAADPDRPVERERVVETSPRERANEARDRQREQFGGFHFAPAFFGWLVAVGLGVILLALVSAAGAAVGLTNPPSEAEATANATEIGIGSAIALLVVLFLAYFAGGYVAGRMARFAGAKHGFGVWAIALLVTIVLAVLGAVAGAEYNVLSQLNLPSIPVQGESLAQGGAIALVVTLVVTLVAAVLGGQIGVRFHKKVDRAGLAF